MAVKIRMKMMGRKHRPFFRICAIDGRNPRDGRVLEELGTYDPMVNETDARALLNGERINYWLSVGAQPSDRVKVLIKKYGTSGTHVAAQQSAREKLALPKIVPDAGEPVYVRPEEGAAPSPAPAAAEAAVATSEAAASETAEADEPAANAAE
ncbi:MAG: 30S ribosomal protein S16 [Pirellulales bacterium]